MNTYIIVKFNQKKKQREYLKVESKDNMEWTSDHEQANKYNDYDVALLDWAYAIKWYNPDGDRIFIPIYEPNQEPWK